MAIRKHVAIGALAAMLGAGALGLAAVAPISPARSQPAQAGEEQGGRGARAEPRRIRVIDGDTLEDLATGTVYRIQNIDTPETGPRARCAAERALGARATEAARSLVNNAAAFEIRPSGRLDRYRRSIALVRIDGRDFGETLIARGFARPWRGRREPWCGADGALLP